MRVTTLSPAPSQISAKALPAFSSSIMRRVSLTASGKLFASSASIIGVPSGAS